MKGKKGILLLVLLVIIGSLVYWQFFLKKKPKKKKAPQPKPAVEQAAPEATPPEMPGALPSPQPGLPPDSETPPPEPEIPDQAPPGLTPPGLPETQPGAAETQPSEPGIPKAQQLGTETQPLIQATVGQAIRIAEGSTFFLSGAQVEYQGQRPLQYQWELLSGPEEKIEIQGERDLKARITLGNLEKAQEFVLRLKVTDGLTEATEDLSITGFPANLKVVARVGGALVGVKHMGDKWVAARGNQLEIYSSEMKLLAEQVLEFPIVQFFANVDASGKGAIFAQGSERSWVVVQQDPVSVVKVSRLPMMGRKILHIVPFELEGQPYLFALLEKNVELWNLSEPRKPRLKSSIATQLKDPRFLAFMGRHLYVADEETIQIIEFSTGKPVAAIPSGGSVTALQSYSIEKKHFLLAAIGRDRTQKNRKDYGLRIFEIGEGGRLGQEKRVAVDDGVPVQKARVIPGVDQALLSVWTSEGVQLKIFDLKTQKVIPIKFTTPPNFIALSQFVTGKISDQPVAVIADGNQLRVFSFQGVGTPPTEYTVKEILSVPGIMQAAWVENNSDGTKVWVGDEGSAAGGSLTVVNGADLKVTQTTNSSGFFPVDGELRHSGETGVLLYLTEDPKSLPMESSEGSLGLISLGGEGKLARSKPFLGIKNPQGELRPLGVAAHQDEAGLKIGVAIARVAGAIGGSGLVLLQKGPEQGNQSFVDSDLAQAIQLVPLQDARDVAFSPDGKAAFLASGLNGVIAVDLEKKSPVSRMSLGAEDWFADRVLVAHGGNMVLASFIQPSSKQVIVKIFGVLDKLQMQEYATIQDLQAVQTVEGLRAPRLALTEDDLYLFVPLKGQNLAVLNLSNPAIPFKIAETPVPGEIRAISLANKFKDIFVALGKSGLAKLEFGF